TTRFVVPLLDVSDTVLSVERLNPSFEIAGVRLVMATQLAAAVPVRELGVKVTTVADQDYRIIDALDVLIGTA
ncbi:CcdB family protein, partial [Sphingomonas sp.]|uniref:CcdB family protein n=1 Tax=Sphingomonas sp. TaxID=28214 RepID=UPI002CAC05D4